MACGVWRRNVAIKDFVFRVSTNKQYKWPVQSCGVNHTGEIENKGGWERVGTLWADLQYFLPYRTVSIRCKWGCGAKSGPGPAVRVDQVVRSSPHMHPAKGTNALVLDLSLLGQRTVSVESL